MTKVASFSLENKKPQLFIAEVSQNIVIAVSLNLLLLKKSLQTTVDT